MYLANNAVLKDLTFTECSDNYGGAVYVFFNSEKNEVTINDCTFNSNFLLENNNNAGMSEGSALLLVCQKVSIEGCSLIDNKGNGGVIKYSEKFDIYKSISIILKSYMFDRTDENVSKFSDLMDQYYPPKSTKSRKFLQKCF